MPERVNTKTKSLTLGASRCNPAIRAFSRRVLHAGTPKKLALTACMRTLLTIVNAVMRNANVVATDSGERLTSQTVANVTVEPRRAPASSARRRLQRLVGPSYSPKRGLT